jgi:hypothetical protein
MLAEPRAKPRCRSARLHPLRGKKVRVHNLTPHVPRIGELVSFDPRRSYQVIDVLWHLGGDDPYVSITACELNWHKHIAKATAFWENANQATR